IMGICRGYQTINDALGGTIKNIGDTSHSQNIPGEEALHQITIQPQTILARCMDTDVIGVNSFHRQSVGTLGEGLRVSAYADDGT
ncbi:gamma-glutamyl-gamma-aminobutyrate hydrolase family protein, partial [Pseudoalteromonas sp. SIMBA_162]|uniref:gamma-glutamyl-gamma-aminobutyrate hydrolase family protein n=1 Tax=Pseudoalteromonas sp. SIMBA_162 TaxID=3080867 RepID=UPI0039784B21